MKSYKFLEGILCRIKSIENTLKILSQSKLSVEDKIEQIGLLEEIKHEIISHEIVKESLVEASAIGNNKRGIKNRQIKLMEILHKSSSAIPISLVKSLSQAKVECQNLWRMSRYENNNLEKLKKRFAELINLLREVVSIKSQQLKCSEYDSLLANYDLDFTEKNIKEIFPKIGRFFCESVDKLIEKQEKEKITDIQQVTTQKQIELGSLCLQKMGITLHRTSCYYPIDYDESNFSCSLLLLLRCGGREIYQKRLAHDCLSTPITGHAIYEAQGILMERMIGTSREFIEFIQPYVKEKFSVKGKSTKFTSFENLYLIFNKINLSSMLKNADELSLLAHIMLRTRLEQNIMNKTLELKDLQDAWLEGMRHYKIPAKPKNELDTYFQDEYWVSGIMGYFPIKVIALITAIQVFSFLKREHCHFLAAITKGDFSLLISWLSNNFCSTKYGFHDLLKKVTGRGLDVECCTNYLSQKYNLSK